MKGVTVDRRKHLADEPRTGHNRWHPDIPPALEVDEGEDVALETRDAGDGHLGPGSTVADLATLPAGAIHHDLPVRSRRPLLGLPLVAAAGGLAGADRFAPALRGPAGGVTGDPGPPPGSARC